MNETVKQYQTHQVLTSKNSLTEMNYQFLKIETPPTLTQEQKIDLENLKRKFKENYE